MPPAFLVGLRPPDPAHQRPRVGQRVRWPGDDREWVWTGAEWVGTRTTFDGGDAWEGRDDEDGADEGDGRADDAGRGAA